MLLVFALMFSSMSILAGNDKLLFKKDIINYSLLDLSGEPQDLAQYRGKWVLLNFWATWCPPCRREMPDLNDLNKSEKNLVVVGVNYHQDGRVEMLKTFAEGLMLDLPIVLLTSDKTIRGLSKVSTLPSNALIDPTGKLVAEFSGVVNPKGVVEFIKNYKPK